MLQLKYTEMKKSIKINNLKKYFKKRKDVIIAFLFGSQSKDLEREFSDWDIAILLKEKKLEKENEIWSDLVDILEKEVDLVEISDAPPILVSRILREGIPLKIEEGEIYLDLLLKTIDDANYFFEFSKDYYQIYNRSKSISETDKARLKKILIFLRSCLDEFENFKKLSFEEYLGNVEKRRNVERWVENIINAVLDISKIILAVEKRILPDTYKKIIMEASILLNLNSNEREKFSEWVILRNIVAHEYLEILWERISQFIKDAKPYLEKFLKKTENFLERKS